MALKIFHAINALIGLGIGIFCAVWTEKAASDLGISFFQPAGITDFRATYGGMCLAVGVYFAWALFSDDNEMKSATRLAFLLYLGLCSTRLYGLFHESPQSQMMYLFFVIEAAFTGVAFWLLRRNRSSR